MKAMTDSVFELKTVLKEHAQKYPLMQPKDAVKLIYQNEFGSAHMLPDLESCLQDLRREYENVEKNEDLPALESIGNGILRVNLAALREEELEQLGRDFIDCACRVAGSMSSFLQKLEALRQLTREGCFAFGMEELEAYLAEYEKAGFPPVSHSEAYRKAYRPAYRVVKE